MSEVIKTLNYNKYFIQYDLKSNEYICKCIKFIAEKEKAVNKSEIFTSIVELGRNISENAYITISHSFEKKILDKSEYKNEYKSSEIFSNIDDIIYQPKIKEFLIKWFKDNGIVNFVYNENNIDILNKNLTNSNSIFNDDITEIIHANYNNETLFDGNLNDMKNHFKKNGIIIGTNAHFMSAIYENIYKRDTIYNKIINHNFKLEPLVNISLMIYYLHTIKTKINNGTTRKLNKILKPFPYLLKIYEKEYSKPQLSSNEKKQKNIEIINTINKYFKIVLYYFSMYLKNEITVENNEEITFSEKNFIPKIDSDWSDFNFLTTKYVSLNPFLTAYEYLLQILSTHQKNNLNTFCCEKCNKTILYRQHLCYECKCKLYEEIIPKLKRQKKDDKANTTDEEYQNLKKNHNAYTPIIEKYYYDREYQREREASKRLTNLQ